MIAALERGFEGGKGTETMLLQKGGGSGKQSKCRVDMVVGSGKGRENFLSGCDTPYFSSFLAIVFACQSPE